MVVDRLRELTEMADLAPGYRVHDLSVDALITMDCDISKTDRGLEAAA